VILLIEAVHYVLIEAPPLLEDDQNSSSPVQDPDRVAAWSAMQDDIAALSTRGHREVVDAGHNIPIEAPASVVQAIISLLIGST
jgi:hypothetical protein